MCVCVCDVCLKAVRSNQRGIYCDSCSVWNHASCINIDKHTYEELANSSNSFLPAMCT